MRELTEELAMASRYPANTACMDLLNKLKELIAPLKEKKLL